MTGAIDLPAEVWRKLNHAWAGFFFLMGALNIYVAFYYGLDLDADTRREIWVNFKLFGMMGLTMLFVVAQAFYLAKHMPEEEAPSAANSDTTDAKKEE